MTSRAWRKSHKFILLVLNRLIHDCDESDDDNDDNNYYNDVNYDDE